MHLPKIRLIPGSRDMITGKMIHKADTSLMQFFTYGGIISMQLTEIIGEIKSIVESKIDSRVDPCPGKSIRAFFDPVQYRSLRP